VTEGVNRQNDLLTAMSLSFFLQKKKESLAVESSFGGYTSLSIHG